VKLRAVLDTNVLLSEARHELLFLAHQRAYTLIWSSFLVGECVRIRTELAIRHGQDRELYRARINAFIHQVTQVAVIVDYTRITGGNYREWLRDPDDEPVLAAALVGKAHYVVSLNTRDFPPEGQYAGVQYATPAQFLADLYRQFPRRRLQEAFVASGYRLP
jgi:predicted nucleic acid-binding protein